MTDYDVNTPCKYLMNLKASNSLGLAMHSFCLREALNVCNIEKFSLNSTFWWFFILDVYLIKTLRIHDFHNDLPFCSENNVPPHAED